MIIYQEELDFLKKQLKILCDWNETAEPSEIEQVRKNIDTILDIFRMEIETPKQD